MMPPADAVRVDDTLVVWFGPVTPGSAQVSHFAFIPAPPAAPPAAPATPPRKPVLLKVLLCVFVGLVAIPLLVALLPAGAVAGLVAFAVLIVRGIRQRRRRAPGR